MSRHGNLPWHFNLQGYGYVYGRANLPGESDFAGLFDLHRDANLQW